MNELSARESIISQYCVSKIYLVDHQFPEFPPESGGDYNDEPPEV
jgi:hypothetical protein